MSVGEGWEPPLPERPWSDFHWWKVSTRGALLLVILSEKPVWYTGHFVDDRMWPCLGSECELCNRGVGSQVRYVFAAVEASTHKPGLIEVGRTNGLLIRDWMSRKGGLRGMCLEFVKHTSSRRSRTLVSYVDGEPPLWIHQVPCPDVVEALYLTWDKAHMPAPGRPAPRMAESLP